MPLGLAPPARLAALLPLSFPNKFSSDAAQYGVDFVLLMSGTADNAVSGYSISALPADQAGLTIYNESLSGTQVLFWIPEYGLLINGKPPSS